MASQRMIRINEEIRREISDVIKLGLKDPRVQDTLISVVTVDTTNDLKSAKVYVSVLGDKNKQDDVMEGLNMASGYIRREIARRINLRNTPELIFKLDHSIEYSARMFKVIDDVVKESEKE